MVGGLAIPGLTVSATARCWVASVALWVNAPATEVGKAGATSPLAVPTVVISPGK